jgi:exopolysaccharide production protein ExoZ
MIWSLQSLRFVAALMVVYVHAAEAAYTVTGSAGLLPLNIVSVGSSGVDLFFVLTGVVIAKAAPGLTAAEFAWRRIRRTVPIYFLFCIPAVLIALPNGIVWRDLLATFLLWPATYVMTAPLLAVAWPLSFGMLFYGCTALVLLDRRWLYALPFAYAVAFLLRPWGPIFEFLGNSIMIEFLFGVLIAQLPGVRFGSLGIALGAALLLAVGLLDLAPDGDTVSFLGGYDNLRRVVLFGIPAALIVYGTMQITARPSVWIYLGDASYCLYLLHPFAVAPLLALWRIYPVNANIILMTGIIASILLAWRVHELVEKPILRALGRRQIRAVAT